MKLKIKIKTLFSIKMIFLNKTLVRNTPFSNSPNNFRSLFLVTKSQQSKNILISFTIFMYIYNYDRPDSMYAKDHLTNEL